MPRRSPSRSSSSRPSRRSAGYVHLPEMAERGGRPRPRRPARAGRIDAIRAREIAVEDDEIDGLYHATFDEVVELMRAGPGQRRARHADRHRLALPRADRRPGDEHRRGRRLPRDRRGRGPQPLTLAAERVTCRGDDRTPPPAPRPRRRPGWPGTAPTRPGRCPTRARSRPTVSGSSWPASASRRTRSSARPRSGPRQTAEIVAEHLGLAVGARRPAGRAASTSRTVEAILRDAGDPTVRSSSATTRTSRRSSRR